MRQSSGFSAREGGDNLRRRPCLVRRATARGHTRTEDQRQSRCHQRPYLLCHAKLQRGVLVHGECVTVQELHLGMLREPRVVRGSRSPRNLHPSDRAPTAYAVRSDDRHDHSKTPRDYVRSTNGSGSGSRSSERNGVGFFFSGGFSGDPTASETTRFGSAAAASTQNGADREVVYAYARERLPVDCCCR